MPAPEVDVIQTTKHRSNPCTVVSFLWRGNQRFPTLMGFSFSIVRSYITIRSYAFFLEYYILHTTYLILIQIVNVLKYVQSLIQSVDGITSILNFCIRNDCPIFPG